MCVYGREDAQALLAAGADASAVDREGRDAVAHVCESYGTRGGVVATLLAGMATDDARRASVNRVDLQGRTPLMVATDCGDIQALVAAGADVQLLDIAARTRAAFVGRPHIYVSYEWDEWARALPDVLMALGPKARRHHLRTQGVDFLRLAAWGDMGGASCVQRLLDLGADVRAVDAAGHDVFRRAKSYSSDVLRVLLGALGSDEERRGVMQRPDMVAAGVEYPPPLTENE